MAWLCRMQNKMDCPNLQARGGLAEETSEEVVGNDKVKLGMDSTDPQNHSQPRHML